VSYVLTDISPRTMMCPLPKGYWWKVRLIQRLNSVHIELHKGRGLLLDSEITTACVVLNFSKKTDDDVVQAVIDGSYEMWQELVHSSYQKDGEWEKRAAVLRERLHAADTKVKVKVQKIR
jgi:hypothetical protein